MLDREALNRYINGGDEDEGELDDIEQEFRTDAVGLMAEMRFESLEDREDQWEECNEWNDFKEKMLEMSDEQIITKLEEMKEKPGYTNKEYYEDIIKEIKNPEPYIHDWSTFDNMIGNVITKLETLGLTVKKGKEE